MLDLVNRANASFYPVNPRGLEVFDSPINAPLPLDADRARIRARTEMLQTLAENTDGIAVVNTNDLSGAMKRIVDDLSNYYLLGYYSTGKLDGKFHSITVRVKRPGVRVRARRGYLASTPADAHRGRGGEGRSRIEDGRPIRRPPLPPTPSRRRSRRSPAMREVPLRLQAAAGWKGKPDAASAAMRVVGRAGHCGDGRRELERRLRRDHHVDDAGGCDGGDGTRQRRARRDVRLAVNPSSAAAPGDYAFGRRGAGPASIPSNAKPRGR